MGIEALTPNSVAATTDIFVAGALQAGIDRLSSPARSVWAKTGGPTEWLPLYQHLADSGAIAELLYDNWLAPQIKRRWERWEVEPGAARTLAILLASAHDVGKAAPAFVAQSEPLAQRARDAGLPCHIMNEIREDRKALPHALIGQAAMYAWLLERGLGKSTALGISSVVGAHHGRPVGKDKLLFTTRYPHGMGGAPWAAVRTELLDWTGRATGLERLIEEGLIPPVPLPMLVELSGFVIVADWLASNTRLFPLCPRSDERVSLSELAVRTRLAWDDIAMPPPWAPTPFVAGIAQTFEDRFGFAPNAVQKAVAELADSVDVGLMFIETTTGNGKTEAAQFAAELIACRRGSQGLLIALPTQATTNAMFTRVMEWVEKLPPKPVSSGAWAVSLGHSKARLNQMFAELSREVIDYDKKYPVLGSESSMHENDEDGRPVDPDDLCNAAAHPWFAGRKRRLLANFAIVTIDQVLMAGLQRRHLMLSHLALSGKVVVIDEAHASDEYMNEYLDVVLNWLGAYQVPVIVLSATLTAARRKALLNAYAPLRHEEVDSLDFDPKAYPLVTVIPRDEKLSIIARHVPVPAERSVEWKWVGTSDEAVLRVLREQMPTDGCALIIRNTVADAQRTADAVEEAGLGPVTLNHAAFIAVDRAANDEDLRARFGNKGDAVRPRREVVVATQVAEQSLDVDFDLLISDLAPIDLLFQRVGRLHRHSRIRPDGLERASLFIIADAEPDALPQPTRGSLAVYGPHLLGRTAAALLDHGGTLHLPEDVMPLVESALGTRLIGSESWREPMTAAAMEYEQVLATQRSKAAEWRIEPWEPYDERGHLGQWLSSSNDPPEALQGATVRDTQPSLEVIIVPLSEDGSAAIRPPWLADSEIPEVLDTSTLPSEELAREIASWSVRLPSGFVRYRIDDIIEAIGLDERTRRWKWRRHPILKGELFIPMKRSTERSETLNTELTVGQTRFELTYSPSRGLEVASP